MYRKTMYCDDSIEAGGIFFQSIGHLPIAGRFMTIPALSHYYKSRDHEK